MKKMCVIASIVWIIMLLLPLSVIGKESELPQKIVETPVSAPSTESKQTFKVLDTESGKITEMSAEDYIFCVVAAEMPALYNKEALKSQAVAAYTFALKRSEENKDKDYDITTDYTKDQSFITLDKAKEKWGEKAVEYIDKIKSAIEETNGYKITYNNEPILAVYHAVSSGKTSGSEDVWGVPLAYLKPVLSEWDKLYENYISEAVFTTEEIKEKFSDVQFTGEEEKYFTAPKHTESSAVKEINVCGKVFSGDEIREKLNLRSTNFEVNYTDGKFKFTVYGYGHGVGMSQYGAECMAKKGSDFKEILTYYYTDCQIEK